MTKKKNIFVASSTSAMPLAKKLKTSLSAALDKVQNEAKTATEKGKFDVEIREWYDPAVCSPGSNILGALAIQKHECDFAIVLLTKDDFGQKKGESVDLPRDNTIFELGFFTGELGIDRCLMVCTAEESALPTDLKGIIRIDIPQYMDLKSDDGLREAADYTAARVLNIIKSHTCFEHPKLPIVTRAELSAMEKPKKDGGNLEMIFADTAVVVNSVQPVEVNDADFCKTVLANLKSGAQYEYYYGEFRSNIVRTANLIFYLATAGLEIEDGHITENDLKIVCKNLVVMQRNLSIHFRRRPPLQFCVHNAGSVETAGCYLRCHGDYQNDFVRWTTGQAAIEVADELRTSCKELKKESSIFHSTIDCELDKVSAMNAIKGMFPEDLAADFYKELSQRCVGA